MSDVIYRLPPWRRAGPVLAALSAAERDWGLRQFNVPEAWRHSRGAGVRVAVLDTGCDLAHEDLAGQILAAQDFTGSPYGAGDVQSHGTHCAGIIAARENDMGVVGICPDLAHDGGGLLVGKVLGDDGAGLGSWIAAGLDWAVDNGAHLVSMSLGASQPDPEIYEAVQRTLQAGVFVIAAAGNDGHDPTSRDTVNYPGRYRETIAVGAVGQDRLIAEFSSRGPAVDIAAPGENILSTVPENRWVRLSGTSMATPFVAGVVALVRSLTEIGDAEALRKLLRDHAEDVGPPGRDSTYGDGLIAPDRMLDAVAQPESDEWSWRFPQVHVPAQPGDHIGLKFGSVAAS